MVDNYGELRKKYTSTSPKSRDCFKRPYNFRGDLIIAQITGDSKKKVENKRHSEYLQMFYTTFIE